jgi:hypothetical protein
VGNCGRPGATDPVLFGLRDRVSLTTGVLAAVIVGLAV